MRILFRGALLFSSIAFALPAAADVFINELHYDDADTPTPSDTNEAIEVVATGGEDLTQYSIVLYNGANASAAVTYDTDAVPAGAVATCSNGGSAKFAVLNYAVNGIQNGAPDAIALVQGATVVQFLSYEGIATASNGPAAGLVSVDIGVAEAGTTVEGTSLQLGGGPSSSYAGFAWQPSATATMGACNNGQSFGAPVDNPPQLSTSTPASGATGVAVSSNIDLTFSEAVTTTDPWFVLDCGSGAVTGVLSGSGSSRSFDPTSNLPFNTTCTVTLTASNIVDNDGSPDALTGTASFTFTTAADAAPTVVSTTPADNAINVGIASNLTVEFSEPVTPMQPNWLSLSCVSSGAHPVTFSGGPTIWTVNPDTDFAFSETCTASISATNVVDQDGMPDPMSAAKTWTFTSGADLAPTVLGTFPANNAVNVPVGSNVTVSFSEPVTTQAGAFAIACGATPHPFAQSSADQTTFTLDPDDDFAADTECTLTIDEAFIADTDGMPTALANGVVVTFTTSAGLAGYYERVDTSSCRALRATLHGVIDDHLSVSYSPGVWDVLEVADQDPTEPGKILDAYHNRKYTKVTDRSGPQASTHYNREHTWPNSLGFPSTTGDLGLPNAPYTDTHMLYLTDSLYNLHRSNSPYSDCTGCSSIDATEANYGVGGGGDDNVYSGSAYRVWSKRKGDMARAVLYMDFRYEGGKHAGTGQSEPDLVLTYGSDAGTPGSLNTLLAWHAGDPPSDPMSTAVLDNIEVLRNDVIQSFQGNRNPLIDHPDWAPIIFASPCNGPAVIAVDDDYAVAQDTVLTRPTTAPGGSGTLPTLLINDHNGVSKQGQGLTASLAIQAQNGTAVITNGATGAFNYTPNAGFCGSDQFTYSVTDGSVSDQAIVHIEVTAAVCEPTLPDAVFDDSFE